MSEEKRIKIQLKEISQYLKNLRIKDTITINELKKCFVKIENVVSNICNFVPTREEFLLLVSCSISYIDCIYTLFNKMNPDQYMNNTYSIYKFLLILMISAEKLGQLRTAFMECLAIPVLQRVESINNPWFLKVLMKSFKECLLNTKRTSRHMLVSNNLTVFLKLTNIVCFCGDYEYQAVLMEIIFRMCSREQIATHAGDFFPQSPDLRDSLLELKQENFDSDLRRFLNVVNSKFKSVFSIKCASAFLDSIPIIGPKELDMWIDFNIGFKSISMICDRKSFIEDDVMDDMEDKWDMVTAMVHCISLVTVSKWRLPESSEANGGIIRFALATPCLISSGLQKPTNAKNLVITICNGPEWEELHQRILPNMFGDKFVSYMMSPRDKTASKNNVHIQTETRKRICKPLTVSVIKKLVFPHRSTSVSNEMISKTDICTSSETMNDSFHENTFLSDSSVSLCSFKQISSPATTMNDRDVDLLSQVGDLSGETKSCSLRKYSKTTPEKLSKKRSVLSSNSLQFDTIMEEDEAHFDCAREVPDSTVPDEMIENRKSNEVNNALSKVLERTYFAKHTLDQDVSSLSTPQVIKTVPNSGLSSLRTIKLPLQTDFDRQIDGKGKIVDHTCYKTARETTSKSCSLDTELIQNLDTPKLTESNLILRKPKKLLSVMDHLKNSSDVKENNKKSDIYNIGDSREFGILSQHFDQNSNIIFKTVNTNKNNNIIQQQKLRSDELLSQNSEYFTCMDDIVNLNQNNNTLPKEKVQEKEETRRFLKWFVRYEGTGNEIENMCPSKEKKPTIKRNEKTNTSHNKEKNVIFVKGKISEKEEERLGGTKTLKEKEQTNDSGENSYSLINDMPKRNFNNESTEEKQTEKLENYEQAFKKKGECKNTHKNSLAKSIETISKIDVQRCSDIKEQTFEQFQVGQNIEVIDKRSLTSEAINVHDATNSKYMKEISIECINKQEQHLDAQKINEGNKNNKCSEIKRVDDKMSRQNSQEVNENESEVYSPVIPFTYIRKDNTLKAQLDKQTTVSYPKVRSCKVVLQRLIPDEILIKEKSEVVSDKSRASLVKLEKSCEKLLRRRTPINYKESSSSSDSEDSVYKGKKINSGKDRNVLQNSTFINSDIKERFNKTEEVPSSRMINSDIKERFNKTEEVPNSRMMFQSVEKETLLKSKGKRKLHDINDLSCIENSTFQETKNLKIEDKNQARDIFNVSQPQEFPKRVTIERRGENESLNKNQGAKSKFDAILSELDKSSQFQQYNVPSKKRKRKLNKSDSFTKEVDRVPVHQQKKYQKLDTHKTDTCNKLEQKYPRIEKKAKNKKSAQTKPKQITSNDKLNILNKEEQKNSLEKEIRGADPREPSLITSSKEANSKVSSAGTSNEHFEFNVETLAGNYIKESMIESWIATGSEEEKEKEFLRMETFTKFIMEVTTEALNGVRGNIPSHRISLYNLIYKIHNDVENYFALKDEDHLYMEPEV